MDKYEYQVCADQIKSLLSEKKYVEAMDIADTIDWRRVKSVSMLCTVSEIYKINKRYEESRDILLLAYERYPNGRMIVYALCELAIKMEDLLQAIEYYKEFVQVAPGDTGSYVLLYKIYEAQDVSLEERIEVLEEFKKRDYRERWAYELAYLYHKTGQETRCVEECDELILWFGEGKYVRKAMELKMEHTGLTTEQQMKYEGRQEEISSMQQPGQQMYEQADQGYEQPSQGYVQGGYMQQPYAQQPMYAEQMPYNMDNIQVQPVNTGKYSTMNLQEELAKSMEEFLTTDEANAQMPYYAHPEQLYEPAQVPENYQQMYGQPAADVPQQMYEQPVMEEPQQSMYEQPMVENPQQIYEQPVAEAPQQMYEQPVAEEAQQMYEQPAAEAPQQMYEQPAAEAPQQMYEQPVAEAPQQMYEQPVAEEAQQMYEQPVAETPQTAYVPSVSSVSSVQTPPVEKKFDDMLAQEYDGQISLSLPDADMVEKQITGQLNLDDILKGWEEKRKESEQKRLAEVKKRSLEQTNDIMSQLVGVIPGIELPQEPQPVIKQTAVQAAAVPAAKPTEVLVDDSAPVKMAGSSIVKAPVTKSEVTMAIPGTLPSGRILTLEEEYGGNLAKIRELDEKKISEPTAEPQTVIEPLSVVEEPQPEIGPQPIVEPRAAVIEPQPAVEPRAAVEPQAVIEPQIAAEPQPAVEPETEPQPQPVQVPEYSYEPEDYGEVEEIEDIEQPEELDDIIKTRDLPLDAIAQANYEAGIEPEFVEEDEEEEEDSEEIEEALDTTKKKANHPSYMTLEAAPKSRREFDEEEQRIFARFEGIEVLKAQIVDVMDDMSMDADKGNVVVMGSDISGRKGLAIDIVKAIQIMDSNFSGKVAKISGEALNKKNIQMTIKKLQNGALIVENAGGLTKDSMKQIAESLSSEPDPVLVVLEGTKETVQPLLSASKLMKTVFDARIDIAEYTNDDLVAYGKGYAKEQEYSIDEMGVLALYTRIGELQALDHTVSVDEVKEIIDAAIKHVDKKNMSHFMDVLFAKRYDDDDYIVLREKDFITK